MSKLKCVVFPSLLMAVGCANESTPGAGGSPSVLQQGQEFVSISRTVSSDVSKTVAALQPKALPDANAPQSFYLAINKSELNQKYFLSAYGKQAYPFTSYGAPAGAATSLGTRVVTFRVQNGKLFVFDVQDGRATSDTFDPTLIIEAYPIVEGYAPFDNLPGSDDYVLFDPAAGLNRFGVVSDRYASGVAPKHFQVDLSYMQNFRRIHDGTTFEQVFTGTLDDTAPGNPDALGGLHTVSGTLGIALRHYSEGEGFTPSPMSSFSKPYFVNGKYFTDPLLVKNGGSSMNWAIKWNIRPGMKPITWVISDEFVKAQRLYPKYDILGAIKAGIENWNEVFGFRVLEARMATPEDSYADDDKNFFIYDADPGFNTAFANMRVNPNSGEIRGASIYLSQIFIKLAIDTFDPQPGASAVAAPEARPASPEITWGGLRSARLCNLWGGSMAEAMENVRTMEAHAGSGGTPAEKVSRVLAEISLHEMGHALGLMHNFKGSLVPLPQQNSVMDYLLRPDAVDGNRDHPGPYDHDALKLLYGMSTQDPPQPFCMDDDVWSDPACGLFDRTEDPLEKHWGATYRELLESHLKGQLPLSGVRDGFINATAAFLRAGSPLDQERAWKLLDGPLAIGVDHTADEAAYPGYTARMSTFQNVLLNRLFNDPVSMRGNITNNPVLTGETLTKFVTTLKSVIVNSDGYRGWKTRRSAVDVLKTIQVQPAHEALSQARATLAGANPAAGSLEADLIARIDAATHPYYIK
ncbi:zinc-dependent metalloprotease [Pendulispora rubella]|uniref:Zinc-dependent metalloprotease n=1 Tax=Pendulispora rubella TaxID=2741070 RepID=A0ABZ2L6C6_9BACT